MTTLNELWLRWEFGICNRVFKAQICSSVGCSIVISDKYQLLQLVFSLCFFALSIYFLSFPLCPTHPSIQTGHKYIFSVLAPLRFPQGAQDMNFKAICLILLTYSVHGASHICMGMGRMALVLPFFLLLLLHFLFFIFYF